MSVTEAPPFEHEPADGGFATESQIDSPELTEPTALTESEATTNEASDDKPVLSRRTFLVNAATATLAFGWGLGVGFWTWGRAPTGAAAPAKTAALPSSQQPQLALPHGYTLPIAYGMLGPQLIKAGAFAYDSFAQVYEQAGQPLTDEQKEILREGSDQPMVIDHGNSYFLLNLLWALGLTNNNPVLRAGELVANSGGQVDQFASTGGWSLAVKPIHQLYSGSDLVSLNSEQQARVEEAAVAIYRPCCNNPTSFPDCNHGMAMLGLLELMAAAGTDVDAMLEAAKMVNSFWYPDQSRQLALYFQAQTGQDFASIPAREAVGIDRFSGNGFGEVRNWLAANGKLDAPSQNGSSCGV